MRFERHSQVKKFGSWESQSLDLWVGVAVSRSPCEFNFAVALDHWGDTQVPFSAPAP